MNRLLILGAATAALTLAGATAAAADPYDHDGRGGWSEHRDHDGDRGYHRDHDRGEHRGWDRGEHRGWHRDHRDWRGYSYAQPYSDSYGYTYSYSYPTYDYGYSYSYPYGYSPY
jgi:Ni/Co efflux regulator RcnB